MKNEIHRKLSAGALILTTASMPFSVLVCHWSFLVFMACWLLEGQWMQRLTVLTSKKLALLLPLFFLIHLAGMLYTGNVPSGWAQLEKKAGFFLIPITLATTAQISDAFIRQLMKVFVLACVAATLICLGHALWLAILESPQQNFSMAAMDEFLRLNPGASMIWLSFSYQSLASGIGLHPTYFGLYLCTALLFLLYFLQSNGLTSTGRRIAILLFIYFTVFILFLSSRIAIIAAAGIVLAALVLQPQRRARTIMRLAAVAILFALIVYINPVSRFRGLQEPVDASYNNIGYAISSIDIRLSLLRLSQLASMQVNPWAGMGTGAGIDFLRAEGAERGITNILDTYDPHNQFIFTFFELGLLGLTVLLAVFVVPLYQALKQGDYICAGFLLAIVAVCVTESALESQKGIVLLSFFGSLLVFRLSRPLTDKYA